MDRLSKEGPLEVSLYLTSACNARCDFCRRQNDGIEQAGAMRPEFVRALLKRFPTIKGVCIAGFGEPMLVPWLSKIIVECRKAGAFVGVITNGSQLRKRLYEISCWDLGPHGYLSISLNATNAKEHQAVFQFDKPCWDDVLAGIRGLKTRRFRTAGTFVISKRNMHRMPEMVRLAASLDLDDCHLHNILPHGSPRDPVFLDNVLRDGDPETEAAMAAAQGAIDDLNRQLRPGTKRPHVSTPALLPAKGAPPSFDCWSPFMYIGVDAAGNVTPCRRIASPSPAFGHVDTFDWTTNPTYARYRDELRTGCPSEACAACFGTVKG